MIITACGEGCFKIQTGGVTVILESSPGVLSGRFKPDIILKLRGQAEPFPPEQSPFLIAGPGEYEIKGIEITGYPGGAFLLKAEDLRLGFLLEAAAAAPLEDVDVLFLPATETAELIIKQLEPRLVIPISADAGLLVRAFAQRPETQEKLVIKKKDMPVEGPRIIVLAS